MQGADHDRHLERLKNLEEAVKVIRDWIVLHTRTPEAVDGPNRQILFHLIEKIGENW